MRPFGPALKQHIESNGMSKIQIAHAVGITHNYLSTIFKKESIDAALMERLCIATGLSPVAVFENCLIPQSINSGNKAVGIRGNANINFGSNEKLYQELLSEKERYIKLLERQLGIDSGTESDKTTFL